MKVVGFTFIRNAITFDFPIVEAIKSIMPLCDKIVVAVGDSSDATRELISNIDAEKIIIIDTVWDKSLTTGGEVLAIETNKALQHAQTLNPNWLVYIQGDEVLQEAGLPAIKKAMQQYKDNVAVDGLLLNYLHFYGSYDYVATSNKWYKTEIRIIKNNTSIYSYKDAQGFRKADNQKLTVAAVAANMHHYGWVKEPTVMQQKVQNCENFWGGKSVAQDAAKTTVVTTAFDYSNIDVLEKFTGTHPTVMQPRIANINWQFSYDLSYNNLSLKYKAKRWLQKITGIADLFEYKNYKKLTN